MKNLSFPDQDKRLHQIYNMRGALSCQVAGYINTEKNLSVKILCMAEGKSFYLLFIFLLPCGKKLENKSW